MSVMSKNTIGVPDSQIDTENMSQLVVRINGTLPDLSIMVMKKSLKEPQK